MRALIYVLKCPFTGNVRYVGKCWHLKARLRQHISEARVNQVKSHKCDWIRSIIKRGGRPVIELKQEIDSGSCWKPAEQFWISFYRSLGANLTNATDGGDGPVNLTAEGRRTLAAGASSRFGSPEGRQKNSEMMKRLCSDPGFLASRTATQKTVRSSPEWRAKQSARSKALWDNPEYREKMMRARAEIVARPDYRAKLSRATKRTMADSEARKKVSERASAAWARPAVREKQIAAMKESRNQNGERY